MVWWESIVYLFASSASFYCKEGANIYRIALDWPLCYTMTYIISLNPHKDSEISTTLLSIYYRWGDQDFRGTGKKFWNLQSWYVKVAYESNSLRFQNLGLAQWLNRLMPPLVLMPAFHMGTSCIPVAPLITQHLGCIHVGDPEETPGFKPALLWPLHLGSKPADGGSLLFSPS